jgi:hypothetical protein
MARLAAAMGVQHEDILVAGLAMPLLTDDQLDYQPPPALLTRLAERTTVPVDALRAMTVEGYVPLLIARLTPAPDLMQTYVSQYWFFVLPEGRALQRSQAWVPWQERAQQRRRTCPLCLREAARPYHRIYWRVAWRGSCPAHGVLLEEGPPRLWLQDGEETQPPMVAHPDLLFLDGLTLQAITGGAVMLPNGRRLHGGSWLRMVRAVIDELGLTLKEAHQARGTLRVFWTTHGLGYREGVRKPQPFEMYPPERQCLLLTVAGTAFRMLCTGAVASRSPWATLLAPSLPQDDLVSHPPPAGGGRHDARDTAAKPTLGALLQQWVELGRTDPASAVHMRQCLLAGARRHPDPIAYVDHLLTELGIPILPVVTSEPMSTL